MKEQKSRKEWIKTVAIVFLSIMLVLTFFSNTIMNYSLAEVAVQYVQSGSIAAKVRGTGTVVSNDPYEVVIKETRDVESIPVRKGDEVSKGDVLLNLKEQESGELTAARNNLKDAEDAYQKALLADYSSSVIKDANNGVTAEDMRKRINSAQKAIDNAEAEVKRIQAVIDSYDVKIAEEQNKPDALEAKRKMDAAKMKWDNAQGYANAAAANTKKLEDQAAYYFETYHKTDMVGGVATEVFDDVTAGATITAAYNDLINNQIPAAKKAQQDSENSASQLKVEYTQFETGYNLYDANIKYVCNQYTEEQTKEKTNLEAAEKTLKEAQDKLSEIIGNSTQTLELQGLLANIDAAQAAVDKLAGSESGTTLVAPISGTIMSINATSGKQVDNGSTVMTIQPKGEAFTMDVTCTVDQAKKLNVGDYAEIVNSWRYGNIDVVLDKIVADKSNPAQNKVLKFSVSGDVTDGQSLSISIGSRSANYDLIVPNSAVREDNNGKFILVVEAKSSPLGNRYIATRYDVEVLASDDKQSAISAALYGWEYVITTSTKPINPGDQVRLANE